MLDFLTFVLGKITAAPARKLVMKAAFAKQRGWTPTITDENGDEITNPVTFRMMFNRAVWRFIREECAAGQQKIRHEAQAVDDTFGDLVKL